MRDARVSGQGAKNHWIRALITAGATPEVVVLEVVDSGIADEKEREWIAKTAEDVGRDLLNERLVPREKKPPKLGDDDYAPMPEVVRIPHEVRGRLRELWEASHANPNLRTNPSRLAAEAMRIGIDLLTGLLARDSQCGVTRAARKPRRRMRP
jgi:hypothetical protein